MAKQENSNLTFPNSESLCGENEAENKSEKILGILWNKNSEKLSSEFDEISKEAKGGPVTKRSILSTTTKLFDPFGLLSPIIVPLKIMFQELCKDKIDWDSPVSEEIKEQWFKIINDMESVGKIEVNRPYLSNRVPIELIKSVELQGFADASNVAKEW